MQKLCAFSFLRTLELRVSDSRATKDSARQSQVVLSRSTTMSFGFGAARHMHQRASHVESEAQGECTAQGSRRCPSNAGTCLCCRAIVYEVLKIEQTSRLDRP